MGRFVNLCRRFYTAVIWFAAGPPAFPPLATPPNLEPAEDPDFSAKEKSGEQRIASVCKHLFRLYARHEDLDTEQMSRVKISDFVPWCLEYRDCWYSDEARRIIVAGLCVQEGDVEAIWTMLQNPYDAMALLLPLWHMLALSGRPPVEHVPELIHVAITMAWGRESTDEQVLRLEVPIRWKPEAPATDGFICAVLKDVCDDMIQKFVENGIDALREKHAVKTDTAKPQPPPHREHPQRGLGS